MGKSKTKEERYILAVYHALKREGDMDASLDPLSVGRSIGLQDKGIQTIIKVLFQANFLKKNKDGTVRLARGGLELCNRLLSG